MNGLASQRRPSWLWWKRTLDLGVVLTFAPFWGLAIGLIGALVRWRLGAPVLFRQQRPGLGGRVFTICKFRTMTEARDASGSLVPDAQRLTPFGQWLRRTSLDELPELFNVLRGDMSLVGPRPLLVQYLSLYSREQARRHNVLPGLTGWAQVNGRNAISWEEKFRLDVWYVDHLTFWLDLRILAMTVRKVFRHEGVNSPGAATMPLFQGNPKTAGEGSPCITAEEGNR